MSHCADVVSCFGEEEEVGVGFVEVHAGLHLEMAALFT